MTLHRPWQTTVAEGDPIVDLSPEDAGWEWTGLQVIGLEPSRPRTVRTGESEVFVLPLAGALSVEVTDESGRSLGAFSLNGRSSVFTAVSDFAYVGRDSVVVLTSEAGAEVALPSAR